MSIFNKKIVKFKKGSDNRISKANDEGFEDSDVNDMRNKQILNINSKILKKNLNFSSISEFGDNKKHFSAKVLPPIKKLSNDSVEYNTNKNHKTNYILPEIKITNIPEESYSDNLKEDNFSFNYKEKENKRKLKKIKSKNKSSLAFYSTSELPDMKSDFKFKSSSKLNNELLRSKELLLHTIDSIDNIQSKLEKKSKIMSEKNMDKYSSQVKDTNYISLSKNFDSTTYECNNNQLSKISNYNEFEGFYKDLNKQIDSIDYSNNSKFKKKKNFTNNVYKNVNELATNESGKKLNRSYKLANSNKNMPNINRLNENISVEKKIKSKFSNNNLNDFFKINNSSSKLLNKIDGKSNKNNKNNSNQKQMFKKISNNNLITKSNNISSKLKKNDSNDDDINQSSLKANYKLKMNKKLRKSNSFNSECSSSSNSRNLEDFSKVNDIDISYKNSFEKNDNRPINTKNNDKSNNENYNYATNNENNEILNKLNDINVEANRQKNNKSKDNISKVYYRKIHKK